MTTNESPNQKLIEVAMPLDAINSESSREKLIRHGHPSTLHVWWARRPLAACRAVLFGSLVNDPSAYPEKFPTEEEQEEERLRLFSLVEELIDWDNANNENVLNEAKWEIAKSIAADQNVEPPDNDSPKEVNDFLESVGPDVLDPFAGGGSIPSEARRLGLKATGGDLNPVATLITKAQIETPAPFVGNEPVNEQHQQQSTIGDSQWSGSTGLARDIEYYGNWIRDRAESEIGHLYPDIEVSDQLLESRPELSDFAGESLTVIAWIWARTVECPNPACDGEPPLVKSFWLSTKDGNEAWIIPDVNREQNTVTWNVRMGNPPEDEDDRISAGTRYITDEGRMPQATFECIFCGSGVIDGEYVDEQAEKDEVGQQPLAIVANGSPGRVYFSFNREHENAGLSEAQSTLAQDELQELLPREPAKGTFAGNAQGRKYGFDEFKDYFSDRQLVALATFTKLVGNAIDQIEEDAREAGLPDDGVSLANGGNGARAYAEAVGTYLGFCVSKASDYWSSVCSWHSSGEKMRNTFSRQAIPMAWDFTEANPFSDSTGNWMAWVDWVWKVVDNLPSGPKGRGLRIDAKEADKFVTTPLICTDPPYYDNIRYADLSDFFYVWLKRMLGDIYPDIFDTILVPKSQELVADPYRFEGDDEKAKEFFESGLKDVFHELHDSVNENYPFTIFYAFKQEEADEKGEALASTGWSTMLEGLIQAGFVITGTWPMRTEMSSRTVGIGTNSLASSIVLTCRKRSQSAGVITRREFVNELRRELPESLDMLQQGYIAPVDMAQAAIGPGMAIYSRYDQVLEADGDPMPVRTALQLINQELDSYLTAEEGQLDADTQFAVAWFEQHGMTAGDYGEAEVLFNAKGVSGTGVEQAGIAEVEGGKVRLLEREEYAASWDPEADDRITVWECTQQLIRTLENEGEEETARLLSRLPSGKADDARNLAYRLYSICERKTRPDEAVSYNNLIVEWPRLQEMAYRFSQEGEGPLDRFIDNTD